jgi:hypothetical protein
MNNGEEEVRIAHSKKGDRFYTSEHFTQWYPERAKIALDMLAQGCTLQQICRKVRADKLTIKALKLRNIKEVEARKEAIRAIHFEGAMLATEKQIELIPTLKGTAPAIVAGIFRDTLYKLKDEPPPPQPTIHVHIDVVENFKKLLAEATKAADMKQVTGKEVPQLPVE